MTHPDIQVKRHIKERRQLLRRMSFECVPHVEDSVSVRYAIGVMAKYFGLFSPNTAVVDICHSLFGHYDNHKRATDEIIPPTQGAE